MKQKKQSAQTNMENRGSTKSVGGAFPLRLYDMLDDAERHGFDHIISWIPNGTGFRVHKPDDLVNGILPRYLNQQTKYKSFQRQLNMYEFKMLRKAPKGSAKEKYKGAFFHPMFVRGNREASSMILRKSIIAHCNTTVSATAESNNSKKKETTEEGVTCYHHQEEERNIPPQMISSLSSNTLPLESRSENMDVARINNNNNHAKNQDTIQQGGVFAGKKADVFTSSTVLKSTASGAERASSIPDRLHQDRRQVPSFSAGFLERFPRNIYPIPQNHLRQQYHGAAAAAVAGIPANALMGLSNRYAYPILQRDTQQLDLLASRLLLDFSMNPVNPGDFLFRQRNGPHHF